MQPASFGRPQSNTAGWSFLTFGQADREVCAHAVQLAAQGQIAATGAVPRWLLLYDDGVRARGSGSRLPYGCRAGGAGLAGGVGAGLETAPVFTSPELLVVLVWVPLNAQRPMPNRTS